MNLLKDLLSSFPVVTTIVYTFLFIFMKHYEKPKLQLLLNFEDMERGIDCPSAKRKASGRTAIVTVVLHSTVWCFCIRKVNFGTFCVF